MSSESHQMSSIKIVRVSAAQYQLTPIKSWNEIEDQVEKFCFLAKEYKSDILIFPEYFGIQYFSSMPEDWSDKQRIKALVEKHENYLNLFLHLSQKHELLIIGGSHPICKEDGYIRNVAHLFTSSGNVYTQEKLHITPTERSTWDYHQGYEVKLFDTPYGRIGIQICYDIEFPEMSRIMAMNGVDIIFVPFFTRDIQGYHRVRYSAQSRAVENYIYSVISGSSGNLLSPSDLRSYSRSAILSPSDVGFPESAVLAEADSGNQIMVVGELDISLLHELRLTGTVKPLEDRREDVYSLTLKIPIQIIKVD